MKSVTRFALQFAQKVVDLAHVDKDVMVRRVRRQQEFLRKVDLIRLLLTAIVTYALFCISHVKTSSSHFILIACFYVVFSRYLVKVLLLSFLHIADRLTGIRD